MGFNHFWHAPSDKHGGDLVFVQGHSAPGVYAIINAISFSIFVVLVTDLMVKYPPFTVMRWIFTLGLVIMLPIALPYVGDTPWASFGSPVWLSLGYILIFTTVLAYMFNTLALKRLPPTVVSAYNYLQPILAGILSISFGLEELTLHKVMATGVVFLGVGLVSWPMEKWYKGLKPEL